MVRLLLTVFAPLLLLGQDSLLIEHALLIDGTGSPPRHDVSILIEDGRIAAVGKADSIRPPSGADTIDASGKTVIPGMINLRGHVGITSGLTQAGENYTEENVLRQLGLYASFGVTTTTSLGADSDVIIKVRDEIDRGNIRHASRVLTALRGFTSRGGFPSQVGGFAAFVHQVDSTSEAKRHVDRTAQAGANIVHLWMDHRDESVQGPAPKVYRKMIRRAKKHRLIVSAQAPYLADAKQLVRAGADILAQSITDSTVDREFVELLRTKDVSYVPALVAEQVTFEYADRAEWIDDNFFRRSIPSGIAPVLNGEVLMRQALDPDRSRRIYAFAQAKRNLKTLADAGVRIGLGSGSGLAGRFEGYFEHREAQLMSEAGLKPLQVVTAFSSNAAIALGIETDRGSVVAGRRADLVILNASPVEDIRNLREIHAVLVGGKLARL